MTARWIVRIAAALVPRGDRATWRAEWMAELDALEMARSAAEERERCEGEARIRLPSRLSFALGAVPHAMWTRWEGWMMDGLIQDVRYAIRSLRRAKGFTAIASVTLALGIGANAAIFALVNGVLLTSPPGVDEPGDVVFVARSYDSAPRWDNWSYPAYRAIAESPVFEGVSAYFYRPALVGEGRASSSVLAGFVSGSFFGMLGVGPAAGRVLMPSDDGPSGSASIVVLGHDYWVDAFGADPAVVGTVIRVGDAPYEIVGVAEAGFHGTDLIGSAPELYIPMQMASIFADFPVTEEWGTSFMNVAARLAPGESIESARAAMEVTTTRMRAAEPNNGDIRALVDGGFGLRPADRVEARTLSLVLSGIAGLVLLLTCANVANLFVARATTRIGEMGVRLALGAGRSRLARQLVTESAVLGALAAVVAVPVLIVLSGVIPNFLPVSLTTPPALVPRVFLILVALGVGSGILFGAAPAIGIARRDLRGALGEGGASGSVARTRLRDTLAVAQMAVSLALIASAGLLGASVLNATRADPGFEPEGVLVALLDFGSTGRYEGDEASEMARRVAEAAAQLPGVDATTVSNVAPFFGGITRRGYAPGIEWDENNFVEADSYDVTPDYFSTMGIDVLQGRVHQPRERMGGESVVLINRTLAERFFPGRDPVGETLVTDRLYRIIGVVGDVQARSLQQQPTPAVYSPFPVAARRAVIHMRVRGEAAAAIEPFRDLVASLDPGLPIAAFGDMQQRMERSLGSTQSLGLLTAIFAGLALGLSSIGLYGLVAFGVAQRRREFGIRKALGSPSEALVRLVLRRSVGLAAVGVVLGVALAVPLASSIRGALFGVEPFSPGVLVAAASVLVGTAFAASWVPARRAARTDAVVSLRD